MNKKPLPHPKVILRINQAGAALVSLVLVNAILRPENPRVVEVLLIFAAWIGPALLVLRPNRDHW
jgi:hypothetical protein